MVDWGVLPDAVRARLRKLEWDNSSNLRQRLLGTRAFPIRVGLKPPSGPQALAEMGHFQSYVTAWRDWRGPGHVEYQMTNLAQVGRHDLPVAFIVERFDDLASFLGPGARARQHHWEAVFEPLCQIDRSLYPHLVGLLSALEVFTVKDAQSLASAIKQLQKGLGEGNYLRALPLRGVDTKFVEQHQGVLATLTDALHAGAVTAAGGLQAWLGCRSNPRDWLFVRPLYKEGIERLGGIDLLQLSTSTLLTTPLPGSNVLIIENVAPGFAVPPMSDTVVVFGGGANVGWTRAHWLSGRRLAYWGDIDTWGLHYLAAVRGAQPHVAPLLMDQATIQEHIASVVDSAEPNPAVPDKLTASEADLYQDLLTRRFGGSCLEQERIIPQSLRAALESWNSIN